MTDSRFTGRDPHRREERHPPRADPRRGRRIEAALATVALSTEPLSREASNESLSAVRHVLLIIPVKGHADVPESRPDPVNDQVLVHA